MHRRCKQYAKKLGLQLHMQLWLKKLCVFEQHAKLSMHCIYIAAISSTTYMLQTVQSFDHSQDLASDATAATITCHNS
jgi:hypothetical protein